MKKFLFDIKMVWAFALAGEWDAARQELWNTLRLAIYWNYRCVEAWEIHYPAKNGTNAHVVEVDPRDNDSVLDCINYYLHPGCNARLYIRYVSGRRKRIVLR